MRIAGSSARGWTGRTLTSPKPRRKTRERGLEPVGTVDQGEAPARPEQIRGGGNPALEAAFRKVVRRRAQGARRAPRLRFVEKGRVGGDDIGAFAREPGGAPLGIGGKHVSLDCHHPPVQPIEVDVAPAEIDQLRLPLDEHDGCPGPLRNDQADAADPGPEVVDGFARLRVDAGREQHGVGAGAMTAAGLD